MSLYTELTTGPLAAEIAPYGASSILMASGVSVSTAENTWQISIKTLPNSLLIKHLQSNKV